MRASSSIILLVLMIAAACLALVLRPISKLADQGPPFELNKVIPKSFGEWQEDGQPTFIIIDPQQQQTLDAIYSQTLSRTYVNDHKERVMLSIAYGRDQRDSNQAHRPEICYPAQGFVLLNKQLGIIETANGIIPVTRIQTSAGLRYEPVTYWRTIGAHVISSGMEKKRFELSYGLKGEVPDGMLFRVSSIDENSQHAFDLQDKFVRDLLQSLHAIDLKRIAGLDFKHGH